MKICILGNQVRSVYLFWRVLMQHMLAEGHTVFCLLPGGDATTEESIKQLGVRVVNYRLDRKGINPLRDVVTFLDLKRVLGKERPDLLFATTIKPVIYGCMAAKLVRIPHIYATITGLGYAFEADTFFKKCINRLSILLYHTALRGIEGVFFQNRDDAALFRKTGILTPFSRVLFARGTGVDIGRFAAAPQPDGEKYTFLVVGRLLEAKGYREYARAASILRKKWPNAVFQILGPRETGLGSIPPEELEAWQKDGSVVYLGEARDVRPYVAQANVVVLPSWREGTPTAIMEAMSMGRACVVTDVPGCREVVRDGVNGFLCHGESINVEFEGPVTVEEARAALEAAPGITVMDDPANSLYPMPGLLAGTNGAFVGRLRKDPSVENGLAFWNVADQIRKGAALNAVQIAQLLLP